jgi:hypothetical protein
MISSTKKIISKYFSLLALTFSICLILFIIYRSEIFWDGTRRDYYNIYYFISFILLFCSIFTFFLNHKIKLYLTLIFVVSIFSFYSFEYFLFKKRFVDTSLKLKAKLYKEKTGLDYDRRTLNEIYVDLKKQDKNTSVKVPTGVYLNNNDLEIYPFSGIANSNTIYQNENGYYMIYKSDRYGFNNPDEEWDAKEIEYLLVGDSATHGAAVNRPHDIASRLRTLSKKNVISIGYSANGPLREYGSLKEYYSKNVKKIVWLFTDNDLADIKKELNNSILIKYLKDKNFSQNLKANQKRIDELGKEMIEVANKKHTSFKLFRFIKLYELRNKLFNKHKPDKNRNKLPEEFFQIIKYARDFSIQNNSEFYLVHLPIRRYFNHKDDIEIYNDLKKNIKTLNINFIDIHEEVFQKELNPKKLFPFEMLNHYNEEGYRKVAEVIFRLTQ